MSKLVLHAGFVFLTMAFMGCSSSKDSINYARWNQTENAKNDAYRSAGEFGDSPSDQNFMDPDALDEKNDDVNLVKLAKEGIDEVEK